MKRSLEWSAKSKAIFSWGSCSCRKCCCPFRSIFWGSNGILLWKSDFKQVFQSMGCSSYSRFLIQCHSFLWCCEWISSAFHRDSIDLHRTSDKAWSYTSKASQSWFAADLDHERTNKYRRRCRIQCSPSFCTTQSCTCEEKVWKWFSVRGAQFLRSRPSRDCQARGSSENSSLDLKCLCS